MSSAAPLVYRARKARSSIVYCGEKYSCVEDKAEAEYECDECKSVQCAVCERRLHEISRNSFHERRKLKATEPDKLCQRPSCDERNFADVKCETCGLRLCFECDRKTHLPKSKKIHRRLPISLINKPSTSAGLNDLILDELDTFTPIKPLSPLSDHDDSLTFVSLPQQEQSTFHSCIGETDNTDKPLTSKQSAKLVQDIGLSSGEASYRDSVGDMRSGEVRTMHEKQGIDMKSPMILQSQGRQLQSGLQEQQQGLSSKAPKSDGLQIVKEIKGDCAKGSFRSNFKVPDITATLPVDSDYLKDEADMADLIADSLQTSQTLNDDLILDDLEDSSKPRSFPLANQNEELLVRDEAEFIRLLGCEQRASAKVIAIFGNTGDGKSYTLNHTFFEGADVFTTSPLQESCTAGIWAAYDALHKAIVIDTEGMLGITTNQNQRMRLLLKILAISDIIIYRTRAERLNSDMFRFLGDASKAYLKHFSVELKSASKRFHLDKAVSTLGPSVIIFHETSHTNILAKGASEPAESLLRNKFRDLGLSLDAFSTLQYVGTHTKQPPTDFKSLLWAVKKQLNNNEIRCSRNPGVVFRTLKVLNEKFMDEIDKVIPNMFPDQYFTCRAECLSCSRRCVLTMNHLKDGIPHEADKDHKCRHQAQFDNTVYTCKVTSVNASNIKVICATKPVVKLV